MDALVEGVKLVGQTLLQPVCAPATVLAALSACAWVPATYFVGSKVRNWDWADDFVAASRLKPDFQLRRINALKHWKELSQTFWDGVFEQAFRKYDRDDDQSITKHELELSVKAVLGLTEDAELGFEQQVAIREMFRIGDVDSDGTVSQAEFNSMMYKSLSKRSVNAHHTLKKHFDDAFDRNGQGLLHRLTFSTSWGCSRNTRKQRLNNSLTPRRPWWR
jgi:hypothetical protein